MQQDDLTPDWLKNAHSMGTSIMSVEFEGGVIVGADSRTTTGSYIANRVSDKLTPLSDFIYVCRSGSAADTQAISDIVKYYLALHKVEINGQPDVKSAANLCKELCYTNKNALLAGLIVAGWDKHLGGQVYSIPLGGSLIRENFSIGGSGSTYIYGYCDANYKKGMTKDECEKFVINGLSLAMSRDGSSGGIIRLAIIDQNGVQRKRVLGDEIPNWGY